MEKIKINRVINLRTWFDGKTLPTKEKSYLSQLMSGRGSFGEKAARRLEITYAMPSGYLDQEPSSEAVSKITEEQQESIEFFSKRKMEEQTTKVGQYFHGHAKAELFEQIPVLAAVGSMGNGEVVTYDGDQIIDLITVNKAWLASEVRAKPGSLRVVTGAGDSMLPTFGHGDLLLIDTSHQSIDIDGVYAISANGRMYIKRIRQKITGELEISSDNPNVKTVDVLNGQTEVVVHGRVVFAWNGRRF